MPDDAAFNAPEEKKQRVKGGEKKAVKTRKPKKEAAPVNLNMMKSSNKLLGQVDNGELYAEDDLDFAPKREE